MTTADTEVVVSGRGAGQRPRVVRWFTDGGLSTLVFMLPLIAVFGLFSFYPIVRAVLIALQHTNFVDAPQWVGLANFKFVLDDPQFYKAAANTGIFALLALLLGYPVPLAMAVLMSEVRRRKGIYSFLAYLPVVVPPAVAILLWQVFFDANDGVLNAILRIFNLGPWLWTNSTTWAMPSIVLVATWSAAGGTVIIYLAALTGVNPDLYDAAGIDGAGVWHKVWHVTLPQLRAVMLITLILQIIGTAQVFLEPYLLTSGGPDNATLSLLYLIFKYAFQNSAGGDYGVATALSIMLAVVLSLFSLAYFRLTRSWSQN
jgi:multiple sugar transport system permease protein